MEAVFNLVLLALSHSSNLKAAKKIRSLRRQEILRAVIEHDDQRKRLQEVGVDYVFNACAEARDGFPDLVCNLIKARGMHA